MAPLLLFHRLIVRPMYRDRVRTLLAVLTVALGVAVVLAIELAGDAAAGSFRSSVETLSGSEDFEVTSVGGIPGRIVASLSRLPYPLRVTPHIESVVAVPGVRRPVILLAVDFVSSQSDRPSGAQGGAAAPVASAQPTAPAPAGPGDRAAPGTSDLPFALDETFVFVSPSLDRKAGETLAVLASGKRAEFRVAGVLPPAVTDDLLVMDIAAADTLLDRSGRVDRILVRVPRSGSLDEWEAKLRAALSDGVDLRRRGAATDENRRMLNAFRWNLRVLSYVALIVGAFLIYNAISVSVVRRRAEIGVVRALGATRRAVMIAFLAEAAFLGLVGSLVGLPLGRLMATGAVTLIGATVNALYVSSTPGAIALTARSVALALGIGIGLALVSALSPASEAALVAPIDAMGRGRRDYVVRVHRTRDLVLAVVFGAPAGLAARAPAVSGIPVFGYAAAVLSVAACGLAIPALVTLLASRSSRVLRRVLGVEALLAARSLSGSLRRTSVLVAALATAIAMTTSVGIMVGSFRETVLVWLNGVLPADLYVSPASPSARIDLALADRIQAFPGVAAVDRFRAFEIHYGGRPATLAFFEARVSAAYGGLVFLSGRPEREVVSSLVGRDRVIVSEPFANTRRVRRGDVISLPLGGHRVSFHVEDVYYDYTGERGFVMADRSVLLHYLPDQATPATLAVYLSPGADGAGVRRAVKEAAGDRRIAVVSNAEIRRAAVAVFDRTFAITYALEAVSVFVAVMGIAGALAALVIDRRRELGLLRFLGASRRQIRRLILYEAGLLGLLANVAGLALGVALSLLLVFVINKQSFGWTIQFHWPVGVLLGALSIVYAATIAAAVYPAVSATRLNPIEVVHEE